MLRKFANTVREDGARTGSGARGRRRGALLLCAGSLPLLIGFYIVFLLAVASPPASGDRMRLDEFLSDVSKGRVVDATILSGEDRIVGAYDAGRYWVDYPPGHETTFATLTAALAQARVPVTVERQPLASLVGPVTLLVPALVMVDGFVVISMLVRGRNLAGFGRSGARLSSSGDDGVRFSDLAGVDEAVDELREIRDYVSEPGRFAAMGAATPTGILLCGPPGCGKTRLARALAGESAVPFFSISGSHFVEMYVGVGAARIRDLFATAKRQAPAIVFVDELDAVGRCRTQTPTGGQDEREATLNQLLVEMDGFDGASGVVVVAATNRPDVLDPALLRPGRFDRRITVELPDIRGRESILRLHANGKPLDDDIDLGHLARQTAGFSGADLANVVNEAALLAMRGGSRTIGTDRMSEAVERVVVGPQRPSRILGPEERERIAYHEAGHAVCAAALPGADRVHKVSIVARGHSGGFTWSVPDGERVLSTRTQLLDRVCALLAGHAAEELFFGEPSTGSADDLRRAADIAYQMVSKLGMSERVGPLALRPSEEAGRLGTGPGGSALIAGEMDAEAQRILREELDRAREVLQQHVTIVRELVEPLLMRETVEGDALAGILAPARGLPTAPRGGICRRLTLVGQPEESSSLGIAPTPQGRRLTIDDQPASCRSAPGIPQGASARGRLGRVETAMMVALDRQDGVLLRETLLDAAFPGVRDGANETDGPALSEPGRSSTRRALAEAAVSRALASLERKGLVTRERNRTSGRTRVRSLTSSPAGTPR
ncbi:MAG TPA: ATP-dependent zinc metalloprotease FtsH [Candidatus Dormibacteraeota bacterium]|nr:ATP-dependent zinc metalloprotease FtsH [Candidatus Dormibacteraeota bacterium]